MNKFIRLVILFWVFVLVVNGTAMLGSENHSYGQWRLWTSLWMLMYLQQREVFNLDGVRSTNR